VARVVKDLLCKLEVLSSNPNPTKKTPHKLYNYLHILCMFNFNKKSKPKLFFKGSMKKTLHLTREWIDSAENSFQMASPNVSEPLQAHTTWEVQNNARSHVGILFQEPRPEAYTWKTCPQCLWATGHSIKNRDCGVPLLTIPLPWGCSRAENKNCLFRKTQVILNGNHLCMEKSTA
jgi:hypothetical protein